MSPHEQAATEWMDTHPRAMALFRRFAADMRTRNRRFGIAQLAERVRWECAIDSEPGDDFKINNNHRAYIARQLIAEEPRLAALLTLRSVGP